MFSRLHMFAILSIVIFFFAWLWRCGLFKKGKNLSWFVFIIYKFL